MLVLSNVRGPFLSPFTLNLAPGKAYALVGPNGAGKTTLLKTLAGLAEYEGKILWEDQDLHSLTTSERTRWITYLASPRFRPWPYTALDVVLMGLYGQGPLYAEPNQGEMALAYCESSHLANRRFDQLSTGEQQRVLLARCVVMNSQILLLDEPTSGLDAHHQALFIRFVDERKRQGKLILFSSHHPDEVNRASDEILELRQGQLQPLITP